MKRFLLFILVGCSFSFSVFGAMSRDGYIADSISLTNLLPVAGMPLTRDDFDAVAAHGRIYCLGGYSGPVDNYTWKSTVQVYDIYNDSWTTLPFDVFCDQDCRGAAYDGSVYITGGESNNTYRLGTNGVELLVSNSFATARSCGAMVSRSDGVYYLGGDTGNPFNPPATNVFKYVAGSGWVETAPLPIYDGCVDALCMDDVIYTCHGRKSLMNQYGRVCRYDGVSWQVVGNTPQCGPYFHVAACEGTIYVHSWNGQPSWGFDGQDWISTNYLSIAQQGADVVSWRGHLFFLGGVWARSTNVYAGQMRYDGGVTPTAASMYYSREVTINGNYLGNGDVTNVSICGYAAEIVADYSPTQVVVRTPTNVLPCTGDVVVSSASLGDTRKSNAFTLAPYMLNARSALTGAAISNNESPSRLKETFADILTGKVGSVYYTLHNDSQVPIEILSLTTNGVHGDVFWVNQSPATVPPNSSASLIVTINAHEVGVYTASLVIAHSGQTNPLVLNMGASIADWGFSIDPASGDDWFYVSNALAGTSFEPAGVVASALGRSVLWPIVDQGTGWVQLQMKHMDVAFGTLSLNYSSGNVLRYINGVNYPAGNSTGIMAHDIVPTNWVHCSRPWVKSRDGVAVAANDTGIYLYGGLDTSVFNAMPVMCYNGTNWSALDAAFRVTNLVDGAGAASGGDIYFSGGRNYSSGGYRTNMMRTGLHSFQPSLSVPQPVAIHAMAEYNNQVYILGGYNGSSLNSVYCYSPQGNTWFSRPSLPSSIYGITATELGEYLYVFGGYTIPDGGVRRTYRYNGSSWTNLSSHPFAADVSVRMSSARIRNHIYLAGHHTNMLVRFDGSNWTSCINMPGAESGCLTTYKLAAFRNDLYLVGADTITTNIYRSQCRVEGGVLPAAVACDTQTLVEISGENLGGYTITGVTFCGVSAEIVSVGDDNRIVVRAASCPNERIGDVKVFSWSEGVTVLEDGFEYRRPTPRVYVQNGPEITHGAPPARERSTWFDLWQLEGDTLQLIVSNGENEVMTMLCSVESTPHATVNVLSAPPSIASHGSGVISLEVLPLSVGSSTTMLSIVHSLNPYPIEIPLRVSVHGIDPWQGPLVGGNVIALTNSLVSFDSSVTSVFLGGISAPIQDQGTNWVSFEVPAHDAGYVDLSVYTASDGDFSLHNMYRYNPSGMIGENVITGWTPIASLPYPAMDLEMGVVSNRLFAFGGQNNFNKLAVVYEYDGTNWIGATSLPEGAWYMSSAPWGGRLYVHAGSYDGSTTNAFWFDGMSWTHAPAPSGGQFSCIDVALHEGDLYIAGGYSGNAGPPAIYDEVYKFDGADWLEDSTLPYQVYLMGLLSHEGALTLFGGSSMEGCYDTVYSLKYGRWIEQTELQLPYPREQLAMLTCRGRTHLVGGNYYDNGVWAHTNVLFYDGRSWVEMTGMPALRYEFGAAVWSDEIYIAGGADSGGNESSQCWKSQHGINGVGGVSPAQGGHVGGTLVTIYGENLGYGDVSRVTLCGAEAQIIADHSPTQLVVRTAANEVGPGDVVIESPTFGTTVKTNGFEYVQASIVTLSSSPEGTIVGAGEIVVPYGESTCVDLVPADYWLLDEVLVDGASIGYTNAVVLFDVTNAVDVHTVMNAIMASNGVPHWWMAENGLTNDFDAESLLDTDGDGLCNWQEYVAGTQCTNPASVLRILHEGCGVDNQLNVITWQGTLAEDRFYTLYYATNLWDGGLPVVSNLPSPLNVYTDMMLRAGPVQYYRIKVENRNDN